MARPIKEGLDYFPFNVDFFEDDKIQFVSGRFGEKGEVIAIKLLCKIYKDKGYYYQWGDDEAILFAKRVGNIQHTLVNDVVHELVKRDFFHKIIFDSFKILTSAGIQKRYVAICQAGKRKNFIINPNLNLLRFSHDFKELTPELIAITPEEMQQSKAKEIKLKEKKVKEISPELFGSKVIYNPETILEKLLENEGWIYNTSKFLSFPRAKIEEMLKRFIEEQNLKHNLNRSLFELMEHFISWAKKTENQNIKKNGTTGNNTSQRIESGREIGEL
ncbi:MAG TPA: DUF4373 domain-containing protein [Bacteroidia bacterium]|nr:DUF4373 domain-containing protein [Bacteroidia bacterium]